jgi:hypothetical protein
MGDAVLSRANLDSLKRSAQAAFITQIARHHLDASGVNLPNAVVWPIHSPNRNVAVGQVTAESTARKTFSSCYEHGRVP